MIANHTLTKCLGLAMSFAIAGHAAASTVNISDPNNIAGTATLSLPDGDLTFGDFGQGISQAVDDRVSDGIPGEASFQDANHHLVYNGFGTNNTNTNELLLTFSSAVTLVELVAFVGAGDGAGGETSTAVDADRTVSSVQFFVNTGSGLTSAGSSVATADTDDVGSFDRTSLTGLWTGVTQVQFNFTPTGTQPVRVAEVQTLVPEPGSLALLGLGGLMVLRRRRQA